jgi:hypothetical protein
MSFPINPGRFLQWRRSRRLLYLVGGTAILFALFALLRMVFLFGFSDAAGRDDIDGSDILKALGIGFRFDLRLAILVMLPLGLLACLPRWNLATVPALRWLARVYLGVAVFGLLLLYILDFGHYAYLAVRINSTVLKFIEDASISGEMVWQSYPVIWIVLGWLGTGTLTLAALVTLEKSAFGRARVAVSAWSAAGGFAIMLVLTLLGLLGRVSNINIENPTPLRWSDAFFSNNEAVGALGLNPVIFLYDTLKVPHDPYDEALVAEFYPVMSEYLGVPDADPQKLNFARTIGPQPHRLRFTQQPNVIFVMLESLGASRLGVYGNPLRPSPNLDALAQAGWFFERFYVPFTGTAKTVWASVTGIPDVSRQATATRNPLITRQHTLINTFTDYRKLYMIGGSAGWANMSALIRQSIDGVTLYQEGYWRAPNVDVWGISDLNLFKESDRILRDLPKDQPFFAYIQTAGNHRPFTIPADNDDFLPLQVPLAEAQKYGFVSVEQFNAVRLLDYNIGRLMEMARAGGYFDNTIFVFFGDHNDRITTLPHMPPAFEQLALESLHVPHIIYAPRLLEPRVIEETVSLVDVLPTIAGLLGFEYVNTTLGRDIQMPAPEGERAVPVVLRDSTFPLIGAATRDFVVRMNHDGSEPSLHDLRSAEPRQNVADLHPAESERLSAIARGAYETSRLLLYRNVRERSAQ